MVVYKKNVSLPYGSQFTQLVNGRLIRQCLYWRSGKQR